MGYDLDNMAVGTGFDMSNSQTQIKAWRDIWSADHGVGSVTQVVPAAEIIATLKREYNEACKN